MAQTTQDMDGLQYIMLDFDSFDVSDTKYKAVSNDMDVISGKCADYWKMLVSKNYLVTEVKLHCEKLIDSDKHDLFYFAINCISKFVQINFTGPNLDEPTEKFLNSDLIKKVDYQKRLNMNNEDINVSTKFPCLLLAAQTIFNSCIIRPVLNIWWLWRVMLIHQHVLDDLSPTLLAKAEKLEKQINELNLSGYWRALFEIEQGYLFCELRQVSKTDYHIQKACDILGFKYKLEGKLGKRTKHQDNDLAQLCLQVELLNIDGIKRPEFRSLTVPQNVTLNDDIRLEQIQFKDEIDATVLPNAEQKLLLLIAKQMVVSKPQDDLFYEEIQPFIELLLKQNSNWCLRYSTLILRCRLEEKHNRTIERSLMQCEELINSTRKEVPHIFNRVGAVYNTGMIPIWKAEEAYADLMLNLGLIKGALDIYIRLQLWEEVIVCYTILKLRHKAAEVIKEELDKKPTVKLYCLLGDATDDVTCYEKAWEFSWRRSHRAQRHWGQYFFQKKQYEESIPHFERSVSINPLQSSVWLKLGFAALETNNWQVAATAYRRYTTIEPDGFEAWNNLAQAYIKLGNKRSAHHALQDALRCNFNNWKVWENFLVVSADIYNFSDVIRAYHKLLDLKEKYLNLDILRVLVFGVTSEEADDHEEKTSTMLMRRTRELLGRVTAIFPGEGVIWELYAAVAPILLLRIQRLQRAYRGYTQGNWSGDVAACKHVLHICLQLGETILNESISPKDTIITSVRLNISSAISTIKKQDFAETKPILQDVTSMLAKIIEKAKNAATH